MLATIEKKKSKEVVCYASMRSVIGASIRYMHLSLFQIWQTLCVVPIEFKPLTECCRNSNDEAFPSCKFFGEVHLVAGRILDQL